MLLFPTKYKYAKSFASLKVIPKKKHVKLGLRFTNCSLIALEPGIITNFQIESIRRFLKRYLKKKAQIFIRVFPTVPVTKKPNETRSGRGKGNLKYWACFVKKGNILLEIKSVNNNLVNYYVKAAAIKLGLKTLVHNKQNRWIL